MSLETSSVQVLVYGHSAFQGNLANLAFSAQRIEKPQTSGLPVWKMC